MNLSLDELGIIGQSPQIQELVSTLRRIAPTDISVLLVGESGVGKDVFARAIHALSPRSAQRMIAINCAAIPQTLLESELFGHEKGAFTGAVDTRKGLFEAANHGTLFLDEIGDMPLATQVKLLRVLETLEFTRVGSTEPRKTDVRVIAATNRDMESAVELGEFRRDLYYRLYAAQLTIPPLRQRRQDIGLLLNHYAVVTARRLGISFGGFAQDAMEYLTEYPWYGNVRELRNFVELVLTLERSQEITLRIVRAHLKPEPPSAASAPNPSAIVHLAGRTTEQVERELIYRALLELRNEVNDLKRLVIQAADSHVGMSNNFPALPAPKPSISDVFTDGASLKLSTYEKQIIETALKRYHGNRRLAARALGVSERTLYRKISDYGLENVGIVGTSDNAGTETV